MKKFRQLIVTVVILICGVIQPSNAQKQSIGLYLTYHDYLHHKLSYSSNSAKPNLNKISIHEFLGRNFVTVIRDGKKMLIPKSQLFGYHDGYNNDYRFYHNTAYQIIDTLGFYMYSFDRLAQQGKGPKPTRIYYFGKKTNGGVLPLSPENVAKVFPKNEKFMFMVQAESKIAINLDVYDNASGEYKINELYTKSLKYNGYR